MDLLHHIRPGDNEVVVAPDMPRIILGREPPGLDQGPESTVQHEYSSANLRFDISFHSLRHV